MSDPWADIERVHLPDRQRAPLADIARRLLAASGLVVFVALVVRFGGAGYVDTATNSPITMVDALYYASVTVTTTGYGDITAVSSGARLATIVLITPARILFLILVVSTTVEVLTDQSRRLFTTRRWRRTVRDHIVICGYGATGRAAATDLRARGVEPAEIVVVDVEPAALERATADGLVAIEGDATENAVLRQAGIEKARAVIVAPNRDDTAVLITLTVRELNPTTHIVTGGREQENLHLLRQGGADEVIDATAAVGRMLGLGTSSPGAVRVLDELLDANRGVELAEVAPEVGADGLVGPPDGASLVAVLRGESLLRPDELGDTPLATTDRLVVLRTA